MRSKIRWDEKSCKILEFRRQLLSLRQPFDYPLVSDPLVQRTVRSTVVQNKIMAGMTEAARWLAMARFDCIQWEVVGASTIIARCTSRAPPLRASDYSHRSTDRRPTGWPRRGAGKELKLAVWSHWFTSQERQLKCWPVWSDLLPP